MKKIWFVICGVMLMPSLAFADTPLTPTAQVANDLFQIVGYGLAIVIMALVAMLAAKLKQKYNITIPAAWTDKLNQSLDTGIAYAEEQANKAVDGSPLSSNDKLNSALGVVKSLVGDDATIVAKGDAWLKQMIEARLNQTRITTSVATAISAPAVK